MNMLRDLDNKFGANMKKELGDIKRQLKGEKGEKRKKTLARIKALEGVIANFQRGPV